MKRRPKHLQRETIEKSIRDECFHKFGGHCAYCGIKLSSGWHVDHVIPWCLGGPDDIVNLFPACGECNSMKSDHRLETFRKAIQTYHEKAGSVVAERFGSIQVIGPPTVIFWFEKQGYEFPVDVVYAMMERNGALDGL